MGGDYCDSCLDFIQWDDQNGCAVDPMHCGECYQRLHHRLRRVQAAARKLADAKQDQARHRDLLRALKSWHDDVEEGTVCHWCRTDLHEDESEIPHTEDCPWRWILDACREAGVEE